MGTSWVALSIKNIKTQRNDVTKKIIFWIIMGGTLPNTGMWQGEVFAISDCLVTIWNNIMVVVVGYWTWYSSCDWHMCT